MWSQGLLVIGSQQSRNAPEVKAQKHHRHGQHPAQARAAVWKGRSGQGLGWCGSVEARAKQTPQLIGHQSTPHFHTCWPIAGPVPVPGSPADCRQRSGPATRHRGDFSSAQLKERPGHTHERQMAWLTLMSTRSSATIFRACVCCLRTASCEETCSMRALAAPESTTVGAVSACERALEDTYSSLWSQPGFSLRRKNVAHYQKSRKCGPRPPLPADAAAREWRP